MEAARQYINAGLKYQEIAQGGSITNTPNRAANPLALNVYRKAAGLVPGLCNAEFLFGNELKYARKLRLAQQRLETAVLDCVGRDKLYAIDALLEVLGMLIEKNPDSGMLLCHRAIAYGRINDTLTTPCHDEFRAAVTKFMLTKDYAAALNCFDQMRVVRPDLCELDFWVGRVKAESLTLAQIMQQVVPVWRQALDCEPVRETAQRLIEQVGLLLFWASSSTTCGLCHLLTPATPTPPLPPPPPFSSWIAWPPLTTPPPLSPLIPCLPSFELQPSSSSLL